MENINHSREIWLKETVTGKIAKKFKEIISKKWEHITLKKDAQTNNYLNKFEYNGRLLSSRTVYQNSEVWDYDLWEWINCVSLGDLAVCPEFLQAVQGVEQEEWINFHITEVIMLDDCLSIAWKQWIDLKKMANDLWLKDSHAINTVLSKIRGDLSVFLEPDFKIMFNELDKQLFIQALWEKKRDIINRSPVFMNKLQKIVDYFNDHMKEIEQFIKDLIQQEQKKNDEIKREQSNQLDSLQKQL